VPRPSRQPPYFGCTLVAQQPPIRGMLARVAMCHPIVNH
jgi:hypothetical protein